jgi:hypothetical protein
VGKWENGIRGGFSGKMKMGANDTIMKLITKVSQVMAHLHNLT